MKFHQTLLVASLAGFAFGQPAWAESNSEETPRVIPRPQIEKYKPGTIQLGERGAPLTVSFNHNPPTAVGEQGFRLLSKRLTQLGAGRVSRAQGIAEADIQVEKISIEDFNRKLQQISGRGPVSGKRLEQAYVLESGTAASKRGVVRIAACTDLGIHYGLVSCCQLVFTNGPGAIAAPVVRIADWPEIGLRLAKTSASSSSLAALQQFGAWLPLLKLNLMGLQFHGGNSKEPGPFSENVKATCSQARQDGILETIVYFCPFRGKGYNFARAEDQQQYAQLLQWILDQGTHGIEVDYNDWPGKGTGIEDVINLASRAVAERNPHAYVLYCPPNRGDSQYRGPASPEMRRILASVPPNVWPLWTGMATLIEKPLKVAQVEEWTRIAGRRPFLWVNRVSPRTDRAFAQPVSEVPGSFAFQGELLPKELNRLFEGVHFNAGSPGYKKTGSKSEFVAYLATAADYVWNPQGWEAVESCRRARRFAEIMQPLVAE